MAGKSEYVGGSLVMSKIIFPVNIVRDYSSKPNFRGNPTIPNSSKHTLSNDLVLAEKIKEPFS